MKAIDAIKTAMQASDQSIMMLLENVRDMPITAPRLAENEIRSP